MAKCECAACRGAAPVPPTDRYLDAWNAAVRASLGKPARDDLPAELRAFVEREL